MLTVNPFITRAQNNENKDKPRKYELAIDLVPLIDNGKFGKIYFKINRFKDKTLKGAYRFGASKGSYWFSRWTSTGTASWSNDTFCHSEAQIYLGYEKYKIVGPLITFYGFDLSSRYYINEYDPHWDSDYQSFTLGFCPFIGIKHHISENFSFSLEMGWENTFSTFKQLHPKLNGLKNYDLQSDLRLPYNFTFNYQF